MMRDQMVREGLSHEEATRRFWALGRNGLIADDRLEHLYDFQVPYARPLVRGEGLGQSAGRDRGWPTWSRHVHPTMLIGTSTQAGAFTEQIVRDMAAHTDAADHHAAVQPDRRRPRPCPPTCWPGPTDAHWSPPAARSRPWSSTG